MKPWHIVPVSFFLVGCDAPGRPNPAERPITPDQVHSFSTLFRTYCSGCHGADGTLGPAPPLNDPLFRGIVSEQDLEKVIRAGRPIRPAAADADATAQASPTSIAKTPMPAFAREHGGMLTAVQIQVLVKEIKGIPYKIVAKTVDGTRRVEVVAAADGTQPKWGTPPIVKGAPSYALPAAPGDRTRGADVFAQSCAHCHGAHGKGIDVADELKRKLNDSAFLALISDQALRRYAITGRPDLGMPDYTRSEPWADFFQELTPENINDVVALLASWRQTDTAHGK